MSERDSSDLGTRSGCDDPGHQPIKRLLIVDPSAERRRCFRDHVSGLANVVVAEACSARAAVPRMREIPAGVGGIACPTLQLVCVSLTVDRHDVVRILREAAKSATRPSVIGIGIPVNAEAAFLFARHGLTQLFAEFPPAEAIAVLLRARPAGSETQLQSFLKPMVGRLTWKQIQSEVRAAVIREAMDQSNGSRRSAARILGLSRTAVQRMLRNPDDEAG